MSVLQTIKAILGFTDDAPSNSDGESEVTFEEYVEESVTEGPEPGVVLSKKGLTEVKGIGDTRKASLVDAGFETVKDLYYASDSNLADVNGIGEYTVEQIREDIGGIDEQSDEESRSRPTTFYSSLP